ncbi:hypothetical protein CPB86DRAFT_793403 [Serendipita vermifera]|nr:hypothetical protein CPB86DRAFT_793403 [Serendipita vermifera]
MYASDSDEEVLDYAPNQVLPVANLPDSFDGVPQDGLEYLFTVRRDSKLLPRFTRAPMPFPLDTLESSATADKMLLHNATTSQVDPTKVYAHVPTDKWRDDFVQKFRDFRVKLKRELDQCKNGSRQIPDPDTAPPNFQSREAWWKYITGSGLAVQEHDEDANDDNDAVRDEDEDMSSSVEGEDEPREINGPVATTSSSEVQSLASTKPASNSNIVPDPGIVARPHEPTASVLIRLSTRNITQLLYWHSVWLNSFADSLDGDPKAPTPTSLLRAPRPIHQRWMFHLLGLLDEHLDGNDMSTIRMVARACIRFIKAAVDRNLPAMPIDEDPSADPTEPRPNESGPKSNQRPEAPSPFKRLGGYWMVIAAVVGIWGQRDLWDEAREQLSQYNV